MKRLLFGLLVLNSVSSFATCDISISQWGVNGEPLSDSYVSKKVQEVLSSKGYTVSKNKNSEFKAHLHYFGILSTNGKSKTIGTDLTISENNSGYIVAEARTESFFGSSRRISKRTLKSNLKKIFKDIPACN